MTAPRSRAEIFAITFLAFRFYLSTFFTDKVGAPVAGWLRPLQVHPLHSLHPCEINQSGRLRRSCKLRVADLFVCEHPAICHGSRADFLDGMPVKKWLAPFRVIERFPQEKCDESFRFHTPQVLEQQRGAKVAKNDSEALSSTIHFQKIYAGSNAPG